MKISMKKTGASKKRRRELQKKMFALMREYEDVPMLAANQLLIKTNEPIDLTDTSFFIFTLNDFTTLKT